MSTKDSPSHPQLRQLNENMGDKVNTGKEIKGKEGSGQPHGAADVDEKAKGGKRKSKANQTQGIYEKAWKQNAIWDAEGKDNQEGMPQRYRSWERWEIPLEPQ